MNKIAEIIKGEINDRQSCFVFPSEAASSQWALRACAFTGTGSVALSRFMAWDRFKEQAIDTEDRKRRPVSAVIRRLFAESLTARNATAGRPEGAAFVPEAEGLPLRFLIPREYAQEGRIFAPALAGLLPSLVYWRERLEESALPWDDEDRDLALLETEYRRFLETFSLFEPAWERPSRKSRGRRYFIFCPELIEDFAEYAPLIQDSPETYRPVSADRAGEGPGPELYRYDSVRSEIRGTVLEIRRLHEEEGIPFEDMAVSVPALEEAEPYLLREFALYQVPLRRRYGKALAEYGAGRLFSLINDCMANSFSFTSLKALILNNSLPWRHPERNKALILFGIDNNCVSGYREGGKRKDIWEEAFAMPENAWAGSLGRYYRNLKWKITALSAARSFRELRTAYFSFRGNRDQFEGRLPPGDSFFSQAACSEESDAVLGRCIEELSALIQLEGQLGALGDHPELMPASPLNFYISVLKEKQYVPQRSDSGVHLFQYRVAAAAPYRCHFVLNASQSAAAVSYQSLKFLRRDKRERLGLARTDRDVSEEFFRAYGIGDEKTIRLRISSSDRTFSGWTIPHSFFQGRIREMGEETPGPDPFPEERRWWALSAPFPPRIFPVQREGFSRWKTLLPRRDALDLTRRPFPRESAAAALMEERINRVQRAWTSDASRTPSEAGTPDAGGSSLDAGGVGLLKVSATDLNDFFTCSLFWLYKKVFALGDFSLEARLLDDTNRGLLYHRIMEKLFALIREEDGVFRAEHLDRYREWARRCTEEAVRAEDAFKGPLAAPLVGAQADTIARHIAALLHAEAALFSGYTVAELEAALELPRGNLLLKGIIDRVSVSPEGYPVIIDYKTRNTPSKKAAVESEDSPLRNFQIPLYITLYEETARSRGRETLRVEGAVFVSILNHEINAVVGDFKGKRAFLREDYQETLDALEIYMDRFKTALDALDFSLAEGPAKQTCASCEYRNICRTTFSLPAGESL
ncbi:MAG: PD-(D/E)XK nuclease family protein [Spirochaetaceae bacterium]|jgi:hypothetical protein|nr:PD-(D/E)XK nuclease family protein [Spirochaetaceae bacterium]